METTLCLRRTKQAADLAIPLPSANALIWDSNCDHTMAAGSAWSLLACTGQEFSMGSPINDAVSPHFLEANVASAVHINNEPAFICVSNNAICAPSAEPEESLIPPSQAHEHGAWIDDVAKQHPNTQGKPSSQQAILDKCKHLLMFNGCHCHWELQPMTKHDWSTLPQHTPTSPSEHLLMTVHRCRCPPVKPLMPDDWANNLGFA